MMNIHQEYIKRIFKGVYFEYIKWCWSIRSRRGRRRFKYIT